ncbi:flavoprotein [Nocardioides sp. Root1257]|uniref:FAD-dependent oxidoreductase n=1 Tax=unclassified Nocardioides TaxID=2615069 RepID=UPI0006F92ACD|nr:MULTISPECIES: FAD-dependent oxidoreductase [unclassified Nocardioides]KQW47297.1 flavoprotein [Nocardioides sp. Root1257]KRC45453.1 flavoprotein [Nocardioides sp. Root224]
MTTSAASSALTPSADLPLVIVGAGPIGLAAAAQAQSRGLATVVLEAGDAPGASVRRWGHVRLFSPWRELVDPVAEQLLSSTGWVAPDPDGYPTGGEWVELYLAPLAAALEATDEVEIRFGRRVVGVARYGRDRLVAADRERLPLTIHTQTATGARARLNAAAVVDASGTWTRPNPLGGDGYPAAGETEHADRITYGIPDLTDPAVAARYAGKRVAVAGAGASAQNVLVGLGALAKDHPETRVVWLVRRPGTADAFGGGDNDQLEQRGALGSSAQRAVTDGPVTVMTSFRTSDIELDEDAGQGRLRLTSFADLGTGAAPADNGKVVDAIDEVIVVTGFRPDHTWLSQVQLDLDGELDAPARLADEIHPAWHSCGSVSPHGADRLRQPEPGLYLAGMKSYGRAPSFLAMTGFEQVRSIVAEVAGDQEAADRVELVLPDSGVCGGSGLFDGAPADVGCCGTSAEPELVSIGTPAGGCGPSCG